MQNVNGQNYNLRKPSGEKLRKSFKMVTLKQFRKIYMSKEMTVMVKKKSTTFHKNAYEIQKFIQVFVL